MPRQSGSISLSTGNRWTYPSQVGTERTEPVPVGHADRRFDRLTDVGQSTLVMFTGRSRRWTGGPRTDNAAIFLTRNLVGHILLALNLATDGDCRWASYQWYRCSVEQGNVGPFPYDRMSDRKSLDTPRTS